MSSRNKEIKNGRGTTLIIGPESYLSVGPGGTDVMIRGNGKALAFDNWEDLIDAVDTGKHAYRMTDCPAVNG